MTKLPKVSSQTNFPWSEIMSLEQLSEKVSRTAAHTLVFRKLIAVGSFGKVYLAHHTMTKTKVDYCLDETDL